MRKIISKQDEGKKKRTNQLVIGGILIVVMVLSTLGYSLNSGENDSTESVTYNGIKFAKDSGLWNANIGDFTFSFKYNPKETEKINSSLNMIDEYNSKPLYLFSESVEAGTEIYRNLFYSNSLVERIQEACLEGEACTNPDAPIKTCSDNFIIIKESENDRIYQQENCVFIEGKKEDLTKLADSFLFKIIGVQ